MSVTPVTFYDPASPFGALAGWEVQSGGDPAKTKQQEVDLDKTGDFLASDSYDARSTVSATYKPNVRTGGGSMYLPSVGEVLGGYHVDSISLAFSQTASPVLTVNGHKHDDGNGHVDGETNTYTSTLNFIVQGIGVPASISNTETEPSVIFKLETLAEIGLRSLAYGLSCTHNDELDGGGEHLAGENHDGIETLEVEFTGGAVKDTDYTLDSTWFIESETPSQSNTAAKTKTISASKHIAKDVA